jgi:hypothetical protein
MCTLHTRLGLASFPPRLSPAQQGESFAAGIAFGGHTRKLKMESKIRSLSQLESSRDFLLDWCLRSHSKDALRHWLHRIYDQTMEKRKEKMLKMDGLTWSVLRIVNKRVCTFATFHERVFDQSESMLCVLVSLKKATNKPYMLRNHQVWNSHLW